MAAGDVQTDIQNPLAFNANVFDGVDDYIEIPHNAAQLGANLSNGFTISAWINPRSVGETAGLILDKSSGGTSTNGFEYRVGTALGQIAFNINGGTTKSSGNNVVVVGSSNWYHVLVTVTGAQMVTHYVNNVITGGTGDVVQTVSTITATNVMRIGNISTGTIRTFDGAIRQVKMWNRVLTSDEIAKDYANEIVSNGLIHHFKLGGDYTDYGSVGVTATNSGSLVSGVNDTVAASLKADRTGATDKYLGCEVNGKVLTAVINET